MITPSVQLLRFWQHSHVHPKTFHYFDQYHAVWELFAHFSNELVLDSVSSRSNSISPSDSIIPKLIHQIWIGQNMPTRYLAYCDSIKNLNQDFEYKLWTESDLIGLRIVDSFLYRSTSNYGIKSDLLRYEILLKYGGWYFDCDFEAIRPFSNIDLSGYNLVLSPIPEPLPTLANGFMACSPSHPLMESLVNHLGSIDSFQIDTDDPNEVLNITGPNQLMHHFLRIASELRAEETLVLPTNYMYSVPGYLRLAHNSLKQSFSSPDSLALHHWGCSWIPKPSLIRRIFNRIRL
jgi:mannosyltransferase OCH1-like enzyme